MYLRYAATLKYVKPFLPPKALPDTLEMLHGTDSLHPTPMHSHLQPERQRYQTAWKNTSLQLKARRGDNSKLTSFLLNVLTPQSVVSEHLSQRL